MSDNEDCANYAADLFELTEITRGSSDGCERDQAGERSDERACFHSALVLIFLPVKDQLQPSHAQNGRDAL
jgi:hypothetical protein